MNDELSHPQTGSPEAGTYEPPTIEVISLSCEISAYAPDEDDSSLF